VFQGWGNNPDLYNQDFIGKIKGYLKNDGSIEHQDFEDHLWNFHEW
jgi:hypothetical protein